MLWRGGVNLNLPFQESSWPMCPRLAKRVSHSAPPAGQTTALITGAASGIGAAFARRLASDGFKLVLVDKDGNRLLAVANDLNESGDSSSQIVIAELTDSNDMERIEKIIIRMNDLDLLINCAGFGGGGRRFCESDPIRLLDMVRVHVIASMRLCRSVLPGMIARKRGNIINVCSLGAFLPLSGNVVYSASKTCMVTFSKALQAELRGTGVGIQALCPSLTHTRYHEESGAGAEVVSRAPEGLWMSPEDVANRSLYALGRRRVVCFPGLKNRVIGGLVSNSLTAPIMQRIIGG